MILSIKGKKYRLTGIALGLYLIGAVALGLGGFIALAFLPFII